MGCCGTLGPTVAIGWRSVDDWGIMWHLWYLNGKLLTTKKKEKAKTEMRYKKYIRNTFTNLCRKRSFISILLCTTKEGNSYEIGDNSILEVWSRIGCSSHRIKSINMGVSNQAPVFLRSPKLNFFRILFTKRGNYIFFFEQRCDSCCHFTSHSYVLRNKMKCEMYGIFRRCLKSNRREWGKSSIIIFPISKNEFFDSQLCSRRPNISFFFLQNENLCIVSDFILRNPCDDIFMHYM